ncbi:MAG: PepSY domain-containing protein [Gammaproteobacteria bacterium]|nr:PepSY domain-containing protein [Gammaproteobacteria bacterium]
MKHSNYFFLICILCLVPWLIYPDTDAGADEDHDRAKLLVESGDIIPLENILEDARKFHTGKVIEVELETEQDKLIYEIEILDTQGTVWELKFDAYTGKLLKKEKEN